MNFVPFVMAGLGGWIALFFILPAWAWLVGSAALVAFYAPVADAMKRMRLHINSKTDGLDAHLDRFLDDVERRHGRGMREYIAKQRWPIPQAIDFLNSQKMRKAAE
jgi:hypothetical protein